MAQAGSTLISSIVSYRIVLMTVTQRHLVSLCNSINLLLETGAFRLNPLDDALIILQKCDSPNVHSE